MERTLRRDRADLPTRELRRGGLHYWFSSSQAGRSRLWKFSNLTPVQTVSAVGRTRPVASRLQFFERGDRSVTRALQAEDNPPITAGIAK